MGRAFFIWVSIFNLFVVSVFWSFMLIVNAITLTLQLFVTGRMLVNVGIVVTL